MGLSKLVGYSILLSVGYVIFLAFSPNLLDINPTPINVKIFKTCEGPWKPNERLTGSQKILENEIIAAESFAIHKGVIYTGVHNGDIVAISPDLKQTVLTRIAAKSRILGLRLYKENKLLVVDTYNGLYSVDIKTGKSELLLSSSTAIDGRKLTFLDDVTVDDSGVFYISDASSRWQLHESLFSYIENDETGRIIRFNPKTGKTTVILNDLSFPNGVQISHDGNSLLFAETYQRRIMKYNLNGPKKGSLEVFTELPGLPDNIRLSPRGGYWVAMASTQNESSIGAVDRFLEHPQARKVIARLFHTSGTILEKINSIYPSGFLEELSLQVKYAKPLARIMSKHCAIAELDVNGKVVQSLQSSDKSNCLISEVLEDNGQLYLGSFINPYIIKVKI